VHVVLVEPEIPWNTGNTGRTCLATGAQLHLVAPLGFSLGAAEVRRAGLDYWDEVRPRLWSDWRAFEAALPTLGTPFFFSADAHRSYWEIEYPDSPVLIFGAEGPGLSAELRARHAAHLVRIPIARGAVRSLNLSTAVALAVFEVVRQRAPQPPPPGVSSSNRSPG
jgi:tRNA (cytidine/uridine-2'-O-)-methyltransferase